MARRTPKLSHLNERGESRMVDVSGKDITTRTAAAEAILRMEPATHAAVVQGSGPKGEVLPVARVAGIMAAKRTPEAIPMCHPLALSGVEIEFETGLKHDTKGRAGIRVLVRVKCTGRTGVEMEALHAAAVAALTIYDMVKALEKGMEVVSVRLLEKTGGKSGDWRP
ncbi:MAG: cyclic pyranopterin monophosphate synthase MoaC [Planctomycetes bacterium]|nr:cyclic pyranopterin monophosphate synthase MoaC [Planctomycetota bacterium]